MADGQYGVYISIRNTDGVLVSSSRQTVEELKDDLPGLIAVLDDYEGMITEGATVVEAPEDGPVVLSRGMPDFHNAAEMTPEQVAAQLQAMPQTQTVAQVTPTFETCNKCGSPKSKYVPGGTSKKTGRPYPAFYGCSNPSCR